MLKFLASLMILFWCSNAMAVCTADLTVCPSGCDYNVLNNAVTDLETNCASPSSPLTIEISGSWSSADTTAVGISGITTSATNTLTIYTTGDARHDGTAYKSGSYKLIISASAASIQIASVGNVVIDGLTIKFYTPSSAGNARFCVLIDGSGVSADIKNNIIYGIKNAGGNLEFGIHSWPLLSTVNIWNNIIYGFKNSGINFDQNTLTGNVFNNTVYGCGVGISRGNGDVTLKNNNSYNNSTDYSGTFNSTSTNNLSKDATAPALNTYYRNKTITFINVTSGSEDFHLVSTDTDAIDKGADLSATFTTDIDGTTRTGTWDIGADEYVSAGVTSATVILGNAVLNNARLLQ